MDDEHKVQQAKVELRQRLKKFRSQLLNAQELSARVFERLHVTDRFRQAKRILFYVDVRGEVQTRQALEELLASSAVACVVPFCKDGHLELCRIKERFELEIGAYGILEPINKLRSDITRRVEPGYIDLALIPGLGFDRRGCRIGYGAGYYDKLIPRLREDCLKVALAFDCQVVSEIPTTGHDQIVDWIATESGIVVCNDAMR